MKSMNYSLIRTICALVIGLVLVLWPDAAINYIVITIGVLFLIPGFIVLIGYFGTKPEPGVSRRFPIEGVGSLLFGLWLVTMPGFFADVLMFLLGLYPDYGRCAADCLSFDGTSLDARSGRFLCDTGLDPDSGYRSPV